MYILKVMVMSGVDDGLEITLNGNASAGFAIPDPNGWGFSIGRREDADLKILYDTQVSRDHAALIINPKGCWLQDHGSRNGCYVRGKRIEAETQITVGELFRVGHTWLRVQEVK